MVCGDSTDCGRRGDRALGGVKPHLMVTDPPYGVEYDPKWRLEAGLNKEHQTLAKGKVSNDDRADWREAWALFPGDVAYVWHAGACQHRSRRASRKPGSSARPDHLGQAGSLVIGRGHYHWQHEPCWYAVRKGATGHWAGDRKQSTLWQIQNMHRKAAKTETRPRHAEAGRVHEAPDREQQLARAGGLRAVQRQRHDHHRRRDDRPLLPRDRTEPGLRRRGGQALAGLHRRGPARSASRSTACSATAAASSTPGSWRSTRRSAPSSSTSA
jgi:hypothetical protein